MTGSALSQTRIHTAPFEITPFGALVSELRKGCILHDGLYDFLGTSSRG